MLYIDYYEIIRKNIRRYRRMANLTQGELAKIMNYNKGTLYNMESENKKAHLSLNTYCYIAEILGINITDLLNDNFEERILEENVYKFDINNKNYNNFNYQNYYNIIVGNIKKCRKIREYSQEKLAERADLSLDTIKNIENKRSNFSLGTIGKIADALNVDICLLFKDNSNSL